MAFINGYVNLPINSYWIWRSAVSGNGYDADGQWGDQCWDLTAEFWYNIGFPAGYPQTGPNHYAEECWSVSRENNKQYNGVLYFDLIYNKEDIKQGDVIVWNGTTDFPTGHIGFADEDYNPLHPNTIAVLGQNQGSGGTPLPVVNPDGGTTANVKTLGLESFAGAFRYRNWGPPPTPGSGHKFQRKKFPWVIYANKLRARNNL